MVERVCEDVRGRGVAALLHYTEQFDHVRLDADTLRVSRAELMQAHAAADAAFLETVRRVRQNVMSFQLGLLHRDARLAVTGQYELRLRYRPLRRVGVMIPGGAAAYPSTLLMTICPAQAAGVRQLAVVMPPTANGAYNRDLLAVCHELGVTEVYRVGGAQAVAALAYGVEGIPAVDMIVGPGNLFVALAKRHVYGQVAIDCIAGPSEVVVLADDSATPAYRRRRPDRPGRACTRGQHPGHLARAAARRGGVRAGASSWPRFRAATWPGTAWSSSAPWCWRATSDEAVACVNQIAPEHLHIATRDAEQLGDRVDNAGAIFLGHYTPVALGDYAAGPSHVLPTGGTARFSQRPVGQRLPAPLQRVVLHGRRPGRHGRRCPAPGPPRRVDRTCGQR